MSFDCCAGSLEANALNDIGVESTLKQPLDASFRFRTLRLLFFSGSLDLRSLFFENVDEGVTNDFALLLRIFDTVEPLQEAVRGVNDGQVHAEILVEHLVNLLSLVLAKDTVVDHDSVESNAIQPGIPKSIGTSSPVTDSLVHQLRSDATVDTTTNGADNTSLGSADGPDTLNLLADELLHGPVGRALANIKDELANDFLAAGRVGNLRVELDAVDGFAVVGEGGIGRGVGVANDMEVWRRLGELVAVGHPHLQERV